MAEPPGSDGDPPRRSVRHLLPLGVTANLHLASGLNVAVSLRDLSETGACAVRHGPVDLKSGAALELQFIDFTKGVELSLPTTIRWVNSGRFISLVGLAFDQPQPSLLAFIDQHRNAGS
jgi:hypothetical protein